MQSPRTEHKNEFKNYVRSYFEEIAPDLDRWNRWNRYYYRDLNRFHQFLIPPGSTVLEVGCGTGDLLAVLDPAMGVGIDFAPTIVSIARAKYPHLQFYCVDAEALTADAFGASSPGFDFIILSEVMGHLRDVQEVLYRLRGVCHQRTRIVLTFHNFLWQPLLNLAEKVGLRRPQPPQSWLSMADVLNLLQITGYRTLRSGRRLLIPKFIPLLSPLGNRILAHLPGLNHLCLTQYVVAKAISPQEIPWSIGADSALVAADYPETCSVIVPARNEAGNIQSVVDRCPQLGRQTELIFVEGHSQDRTWAEIQRVVKKGHPTFVLKAFQQSGRGKADAVRLGFSQAEGDILMILDADLTVQPEDLPHFFTVIASDQGEFVNGSRLVYPRSQQAMPWLNNWANKFFSLVFSFLLSQPIKDTLCGTKGLRRQDYEKIQAGRHYFGNFDPFGDFDLLFGATKLGLHMVDVPVRYQPRTYGSSNISHVREGLILLRMCLYASLKIKFF